MFRRLEKFIAGNQQLVEDAKFWNPDKLFAMRDASARCVCDYLIHGKIRTAIFLLADYVILNREIDRRIDEV